MKKEKQLDDNILEIVLGSILISLNSFSSGMMIEKIFVLAGFVILIVGIIRSIIKYKEKKGLFIFLIIMGIIAVAVFLGLLYKLIF